MLKFAQARKQHLSHLADREGIRHLYKEFITKETSVKSFNRVIKLVRTS